ncbi:BMP family ABC transporter substrate-binding protein [Mycoplasmopsis iners]|uniref:BMP family ABC transporter substrate-binding protein n=1 Tax=Mycoplasmopsis iners TaxID=76630 RepID=UPI0004983BF2|nr:BMP family ABC transporter substrate-binding protein [Mycoplasmopsis iners]
MKKFKKSLLLTMAGGTSLFSASVIAASCGSEATEHPLKPKQMMTNVVKLEERKLTAEELQNVPKIAVVTDTGDLNDKSFNQLSWEGIIHFAEFNGIPVSKYNAYQVHNGNFNEQYDAAINDGAKIIVVPGFSHQDKLAEYYETNKEKINKAGIVFIGIDYSLTNEQIGGRGIFLNFNTKEGGFLAGYAAAEFFKDEANKTYNAFGGMAIDAVTDFIEGFAKGVYKHNLTNTTNPLLSVSNNSSFYLDSGFKTHLASKQTDVSRNSIALNPSILLPVAGAWTTDYASKQPNIKYIVGVDTDQAMADKANEAKYFTSILKNMAQGIFDLLTAYAKNETSKLGGYVAGQQVGNLRDGVDANWVDLSETHLAGDDTAKAKAAIDKAREVFKAMSSEDKAWLNSNKPTPDAEAIEGNQARIDALVVATKTAPTASTDSAAISTPRSN